VELCSEKKSNQIAVKPIFSKNAELGQKVKIKPIM